MTLTKIQPNFFLIGAPKCGTSSLSMYLRQHPNVFFSDPKEPFFFAADFKGRTISKESDYLKLFQVSDPSNYFAIGEGSTSYIFSKVAIANILQSYPEAKFIAMLRNPADLVVSLHATVLKTGLENLPSFLDAWNAEPDRHIGKRIPAGCPDPQWLFYSEWGKLGSLLQRAMDIVPPKHLKVILFDDFIRDTRKIYLEVLEFLGLPDDGLKQFPKFNERLQIKNQPLMNFAGLLYRVWLPLRSKLTLGRGLGIGLLLRKLNSTSETKDINPEVKQMLTHFYQDEVIHLEKLLNRELGDWKIQDHQ